MRISRKVPRQFPAADRRRAVLSGDADWRFPDRQYAGHLDIPGPAVCARCHAYLETDHWKYDERRYRALQAQPEVHVTLCPGCVRVERRLYEGEVTIRSHWDSVRKDEVLHLIHHEEARARIQNPSARIALLDDRGDEIYLLTTTQFLAKRIGIELKKAHRGTLTYTPLPYERFSRVRWEAA